MRLSHQPKKPLTVCHIISGDLWAGAEAQVYYLLNELVSGRHACVSVIAFNAGVMTEKLQLREIRTAVIKEKRRSIFSFMIEICRELAKVSPDIIHVHGYKEALFGGIAGKLCGTRSIVRTHHGKGVLEGSFKHRVLEFIIAHFLIKWNIAVSEDLKKTLVKKGIGNCARIRVIHNGVPISDILPSKSPKAIREQLGIPLRSIVIGTLGRMVRVKGHRCFLEAARRIIISKPNTIFILAGDGPLKSEALNYIKRQGLDENVKLLGFRSDPIDILSILDIFVLTSLHEGVPIVLLEAMALAKPIVATAVGGIPEVLENRVNAILIEPQDPVLLSSACLELMENAFLREIISKNVRRHLVQNLSIARNAEMVERFYREIA
jgi:L-malate glycosyltransferase